MDSPWAQAYLRHFARFLGKPFDVELYRSATDVPLRLATYDQRFPGYRVHASIGLADEVNQDVGEAILFSDDFGKDVPYVFVNSLFFILDQDIPLASRFAVAGVDSLAPDLAEQYDKAAIYCDVAEGLGDGFGQVECEGETGTVYQGIFISAAELEFLRRDGPDSFAEKLKEQGVERRSLRRGSCV
jgi:hypothetical protein